MSIFHRLRTSLRHKLAFGYTLLLVLILASISLTRFFEVRARLSEQVENTLHEAVDNAAAMVTVASDLSLRNYLRGITEENLSLVEFYYRLFREGKLEELQAKKLAVEIMSSQRIGASGYTYCLQSNGTLAKYSSFQNERDLSEFPYIREQLKRKEGYMAYDWRESGEAKTTPKALYMLHFEPWDWIITSLAYRTEFADLVNIKDFLTAINTLKPDSGEPIVIYIMNGMGRYLISSELEAEAHAFSGHADTQLLAAMLKERAGVINHARENVVTGQARAYMEYFMYVPEYDWIISAGGYKDELYAPLGQLTRDLLLFMGAGTALALLFSWLLSGHLMRPLTRLNEQMRAAARGNFNARVVPESTDELGEMSENFNRLMLNMTEQAYSLEKIVDRRTDEYREQIERLQILTRECQASEKVASDKVVMFFDLLDSMPNLICYRSRDGRFTGCNEAYARVVLGVPRHAVVGRTLNDFPDIFSQEIINNISDKDAKLFSGQTEHIGDSLTVKCADGAMRTFCRTIAPVRDAQGDVNNVVVVATDISMYMDASKPVN